METLYKFFNINILSNISIALFITLIKLGIITCLSCSVLASGDIEPSKHPSYISVNVEIQGLNDSLVKLNKAMDALTLSINHHADSPENLSPEQAKNLKVLLDKSNELVTSLNQSLLSIDDAIVKAKNPTKDIVSSVSSTFRQEAINPVLSSVKNTVDHWITLIIIGGILFLIIVSIALYFITVKIRDTANVLRSITEEYEIVRRERDEIVDQPTIN